MSDEQEGRPEAELSEKMRRFVEAYMGEAAGNGTKAARIAGYAGDDNVLAWTASTLLRKPKVRHAIDARLEGDPLVAGRIERLHFLTRVVRGEETEKRPERDSEGNVSMVDCPPAMRDRLAAQEALSKLAGEQVNKVAMTDSKGEDLKNAPTSELFALMGMLQTQKGGE